MLRLIMDQNSSRARMDIVESHLERGQTPRPFCQKWVPDTLFDLDTFSALIAFRRVFW